MLCHFGQSKQSPTRLSVFPVSVMHYHVLPLKIKLLGYTNFALGTFSHFYFICLILFLLLLFRTSPIQVAQEQSKKSSPKVLYLELLHHILAYVAY